MPNECVPQISFYNLKISFQKQEELFQIMSKKLSFLVWCFIFIAIGECQSTNIDAYLIYSLHILDVHVYIIYIDVTHHQWELSDYKDVVNLQYIENKMFLASTISI
jgi:hypothetical protein